MVDADGMDTHEVADPVGPRLKNARLKLGLDLADLSVRTKVTTRHLEAIEDGRFDALPGRPYVLGFSKSYAQAVGLDPEEIATAIRAELHGAEPAEPVRVIHQYEVGEAVKTPSSQLTWLAAGLALAVLAAGSFAWRSYYWPAAGLPPVEEMQSATVAKVAAPAQPQQTAQQPASDPASGPVIFTALEEGVWVKFYDASGNQLMQKQLAKGESYTVPTEAADPQIWTGRPEALSITVGGKPVPKLADVMITMKDVPVSAAALLGRVIPQISQGPNASPGNLNSTASM